MISPLDPYIVMTCLSGVLSLLLMLYVFIMRKRLTNSWTFIILSLLIALYSLGHGFEFLSGSVTEMMFWIHVQYAALPFIPPLLLILILRYAGLWQFLTRRLYLALFIIPVMTTLICWTNSDHHLLYQVVDMDRTYHVTVFEFIAGPWYIVHGCFTFICLFISLFILGWYSQYTKVPYWRQTVPLMLGIVIPMIAAFFYLIGKLPYPIDPIPIFLFASNLLYFWAIFSTRLFELAPLAKECVFQSMRDGVIVLDASGRIIDYNDSAGRIVKQSDHCLIGTHLKTLHADFEQWETVTKHETQEWFDPVHQKYYSIDITPIQKDEQLIGRTILLRDITEQNGLLVQLEQLAYSDALTKVHNRAYFLEQSGPYIEQANQEQKPLSLILFDIDHFKQINDHYGHAAGDAALKHIARVAESILDRETMFVRYGGEEFIVFLPGLTLPDATQIAERMRAGIAAAAFQFEQQSIMLTASFGVSAIDEQVNTLDKLLKYADQALYAAKDSGRNAVRAASHDSYVPIGQAKNELLSK